MEDKRTYTLTTRHPYKLEDLESCRPFGWSLQNGIGTFFSVLALVALTQVLISQRKWVPYSDGMVTQPSLEPTT